MKQEVLNLYKEYIDLCSLDNEEYMPDAFIKYIHNDYLENGYISLPHPLYATWDITNLCNLNCIFCSASAKCFKGIVDNEQTIDIAKVIISLGVKYVSIRGGEPMIVKQLPEIINLFVTNNIFVEIVSNGTGFNEEFFTKINDCNKDMIRIKISLDSPIESQNDKLRGKGSFANAIKSMENCNKFGWNFRVQMVVVNTNKNQIVDMYNLSEENGASSFGIYLVLPFGRGSKIDTVIIDEDILNQVLYIKKNEKKTKFEKFALGIDDFRFFEYLYQKNDFDDELSKRVSILKCNGAKSRINIDDNGDCYPCDLMKFPEFKMGNILEDDFQIIWESEAAKRFNNINRFTKNKCKDCMYKNCSTGCMAMNFASGDNEKNLIPNCELQ